MIAALFVLLGSVLLLPFMPALTEAFRREDDAPLALSDRYREDRRLGPAAGARPLANETTEAHGEGGHVAVRDHLVGPPGLVVDRLRVQTVARLAAGTVVRQRLVVGDSADVGPGSRLSGSAEAGDVLWLGAGCHFERLHAPTVCTGAPGTTPPPHRPAAVPFALPAGADVAAGRALVRGDLALPDGAVYDGDLVVLGDLTLGRGARVAGGVKARGDITLGAGARVDRSAIAEGDLTVGSGAHIAGAAVAYGALRLAPGAVVGSIDAPTTATARTVELAVDVTVHGTVWAREHGAVA